MKTCLKILNLLLLGISALAAVLCFVFAGPITESSNLIIYIGASFAIIMVIVILRVTVLLPERKGLSVQQKPLRRGYEPAVTLIWLIFQGLFSIFTFISENRPLKILTILLTYMHYTFNALSFRSKIHMLQRRTWTCIYASIPSPNTHCSGNLSYWNRRWTAQGKMGSKIKNPCSPSNITKTTEQFCF